MREQAVAGVALDIDYVYRAYPIHSPNLAPMYEANAHISSLGHRSAYLGHRKRPEPSLDEESNTNRMEPVIHLGWFD